jgi:hypothetical protein
MKSAHSSPKVLSVKPMEDYKLLLIFDDGKRCIFDVKPFLNKGVFKELKNIKTFNTVRVAWGSIAWKNDIDIASEYLYENSQPIIYQNM